MNKYFQNNQNSSSIQMLSSRGTDFLVSSERFWVSKVTLATRLTADTTTVQRPNVEIKVLLLLEALKTELTRVHLQR